MAAFAISSLVGAEQLSSGVLNQGLAKKVRISMHGSWETFFVKPVLYFLFRIIARFLGVRELFQKPLYLLARSSHLYHNFV
jgi:hypothetical protein